MERLLPYLGVLAGIILASFSLIFVDRIEVTNPSPIVATSSISIVPSMPAPVLPAPQVPQLSIATTTPKVTLVPNRKAPTITTSVAATPEAAPTPAPTAVPTPPALSVAAEALRSALVNILCYAPVGSRLGSISGSGVFIDPKGIILTNAHVAQFMLLADRGVSCSIRTGSPASDRYIGALIFISPAWISANASTITATNPVGTGEHDIALVAVTKTATTDALPASYPYVPLASVAPAAGTPVVIGSYGAQFLQATQILSYLSPTLVYGSVKNIYTFDTTTIDVLDLGGSAAAQEGSSGGGVVTASGSLAGTIVTSTIEGDTASRRLDAITASYVRADYATETGAALDTLLDKPTAAAVADFAPQANSLESVLTAQL
ncbi:MAG TPA: serine protease [Candidatus Paceibacterota bacterium]|nr:serine protease [Candidatus Paceibacterota bacterium]